MREALGPVVAALGVIRRRRATIALGVLAILLLGLISLGTFMELRDERAFLDHAIRRGAYNFSCFSEGPATPDVQPALDRCQFADYRGRPIGPEISGKDVAPPSKTFEPVEGSPITPEAMQRYRPIIEPILRAEVKELEGAYAPRRLIVMRERTAGTLWGVLIVILFAATMFGAEWRWSVWRTLLTHEPRRWRVAAGRFAALWIAVAAGSAIVLAALAGLDQILRAVFSIGSHGGPGLGYLVTQWLRSLLVLETYATIAAAGATIARTSMVGLAAPLAFLLADGLMPLRYPAFRAYSAAQQVAWLIHRARSGVISVSSSLWFPRITERITCRQGVPPPDFVGPQGEAFCMTKRFAPIGTWHATGVLVVWIAVFAALAYVTVRRRDVPQ